MFRTLITGALFGLIACAPSFGQEATPNHVYQVTEKINFELALMNEANFTEASTLKATATASQPRHVYAKGQDVWRKLQLLRFINGLPTQSTQSVDTKQITPLEVKGLMDEIHKSLSELRVAYGVTTQIIAPPLPSSKSPTDVYANLVVISAQIDSLGIPATVPNDVYQSAQTILHELQGLADAAGIQFDDKTAHLENGKSPSDAYHAAIQLVSDMKILSENSAKYKAQGGIVVPVAKKEGISPTDVMMVLNRTIADIGSIKAEAGLSSQIQNATFEGGKTPSDVYNAIVQARVIVAALTKI